MSESANLHQELEVILLPDDLLLEWRPATLISQEAAQALQQETFRTFHAGGLHWLYNLGFAPTDLPLPEALAFWRQFANGFCQQLAFAPDLEDWRERLILPPPDDWLSQLLLAAPLSPGIEHLSLERLQNLWQALLTLFAEQVARHSGTVAEYLHARRPNLELAGRVYLHLVENARGELPFAFMATYATRVAADGKTRHLPLKHALVEFGQDQERLLQLLATVYRAAKQSALLQGLIDSGHIFQPLGFTAERALAFLHEVPLYEASGIRCRIPNWWTAKRPQVTLSVKLADTPPSHLGLDALIEAKPSLEVGGVVLSEAEVRALLSQNEGLSLLKNRWVELDREKLAKTLAAYDKARALLAEGLTLSAAMRLLLTPQQTLGALADDLSVTMGEWLSEVHRKLANPTQVGTVLPGPNFNAELRPYQQVGLNWLAQHRALGFGACLADDMGLGKTIQVLALLSVVRQSATGPSLLVLPASLLGNWQREISRFLPDLRILVVHASAIGEQAKTGLSASELSQHDLLLTTYGMVMRADWLRQQPWHYVILDEAQAIKNPGARQSLAIKQLQAQHRLALTGTPVENRLDDLWSLFDFLNPGLLGNHAEFRRAAKVMAGGQGYGRLRQVISPYILRRMKTDRRIITDLPDKVEMKTFASLSQRQVVLYRQLVTELEETLDQVAGMQRRGLVLSYLMRFKQLCNHPDQLYGGSAYAEAESGKFARLRELCETILEKHERVLVFTQFRELIPALDSFLAGVFGHPGLVLHGAVAVKARQELVNQFQETRDYLPYMVLSVKAGGVGLNLTRANHVIHFDRWWNPAVENQATDRAFRLGQTRGVLVHKFICQGTVEEKIDQMISDKLALVGELVASGGESWITEMDNTQLRQLFTLSLT